MHIKQTHISAARPNLLKEHVSLTQGLTNRIKHENTTSYIKHLAVSVLSSISARIKNTCNLTGKCFEMPNVLYTQPLQASREKRQRQNERKIFAA